MRNDLLKGLTPEQVAKAKACDDANDLLQLAKEEGVALSEEQLNAISGGACSGTTDKAPHRTIDK